MERVPVALLSALIAVAVPTILVGNALWALLNQRFVEAQYALPGFPDDQLGLDRDQRTELAAAGVRAVRPFGEGVDALRAERLPDGRTAFQASEVRHMADVRDLVSGFLIAWAVALGLAPPAGLALHRLGGPGALRRALVRGALVTLGAIAVVGLFALVAFDAFFTAFHGVFFEGDSWRFGDDATLRRLYPDEFWAVASAALAGLVLVQCGALALVGRALARTRDRSRSAVA